MYYQCYALLLQYIYGNPETLTVHQELVLTQLSTLFSVLAASVPVIAVVVILLLVIKAVIK